MALGDRTFVVDDTTCAGPVVFPGLIDQHLHPILGAGTLATEVIAIEDWRLPDRTFAAATTPHEYRARLAAGVAAAPGDDRFFSWGYHHLWHGDLDRATLDAIGGSRPVVVWQRSCHE